MSDQLNDPQLQALEAKLAGLTPRAPLPEQRELLYQSGYAAGNHAVTRSLRRWQTLAAGLLLLVTGLSIPLAQHQFPPVAHKPIEPPQVPAPSPQIAVQPEPVLNRPRVGPLALDAWQVAAAPARSPDLDPSQHSLAVGSLTRVLVEGQGLP